MTTPSTSLTLRDCALAALVQQLGDPDAPRAEFQLLREVRAAVDTRNRDWLEGARACLETPAPLVRLGRELGLTLLEQLTVSLAAAVEEELVSSPTPTSIANAWPGPRKGKSSR